MIISEWFGRDNIDQLFIDEEMPNNAYWDSCKKFTDQVFERPAEALTNAQVRWLQKILDGCIERKKQLEGIGHR